MMQVIHEATIELEDDAILFMDVEITADANEGEHQTRDYPGCDPSADMIEVKVLSFGAGNLVVKRCPANQDCFRVLDQAATEYVQNDWSQYEERILEELADREYDNMVGRFERD